MTTTTPVTLADITVSTGVPEIDIAAARAKLSVLRATVWPDRATARTEARKRLAEAKDIERYIDQFPEYKPLVGALRYTAKVVKKNYRKSESGS